MPDSKELNSIAAETIHSRHFRRVFGENRKFEALGIEQL